MILYLDTSAVVKLFVSETLSRPANLMFGCFDRRLTEVGAALGFRLLDGE